MRLDSHQHFWIYSEREYPWIPRGSPLHRDWLPSDLHALQEPLGLYGSIAVQARQTLEESRWLLELAEAHPIIKGVVGWVNLRDDAVEEQLAVFAQKPKFRGVRHVVQSEPDDHFMVREDFLRGIGKLHQFGLTYDILIYPKQLPAAIELVRRFPNQQFVLDHIAKPQIQQGIVEPWKKQLLELATHGNVHCKVSGIVTEADHQSWTPEQIRPYLDIVFEAFGPERLMWGSDWPVCQLAANYEQTFRLINAYARDFSKEALDGLFGENAARFYRVS